ncbi:aldose epimerase family protein [Conservatibacter flavescens]|uniref:Aldose 1-epimerase n=1 Tax=Conservatibacter flavescens TaxID=28161 RepID=A0A2M8S161_9PAST|nr:aldose epimerase family protein [Conservatibacter flavescens]PJG84892.1 galactose-1-epimerase [Conservatibacter flavescens]
MDILIRKFGQVDKHPVDLITLKNAQNFTMSITNYGCIVTSITMPDRTGHIDDIVLGYDTLEQYLQGHPFFGAIAGRFANRIADGVFHLNQQKYQLEKNELATQQHLHGGKKGFDKFIWGYDIEQTETMIMIHFHRVSCDGEAGYPGNLMMTHSIGLDENNQVHFYFNAITDKPTIINLTNHSYYNLLGHNKGTIEGHILKVFADFYTPTNDNLIPTGEILKLSDTPLDFTQATLLSNNMNKLPRHEIDHNFILRKEYFDDTYHLAAELYEPISGRFMSVITTQPAIQIYNGSKLSNKNWIGRDSYKYESFSGICFETQHFPNSPNYAHFPTTQLNPGERYSHKTIHQLSIH